MLGEILDLNDGFAHETAVLIFSYSSARMASTSSFSRPRRRLSTNSARDIWLSNNIEVRFEDFVNNYWPHLEFMILSQPDFTHVRLMERIHRIEEEIKESLGDGTPPLEALEKAAVQHNFDPASLPLLRRDPIDPQWVELDSQPLNDKVYAHLKELLPEGAAGAGLPMIDAEYEMNFQLTLK